MTILRTATVATVASILLGACTPTGAVIGGAALVGRSVVQERSTMDALNDSEILLSIDNRLLNESGELFRDVSVTVTEGRVVLTGSVPTREEKIRATAIAWEVEGVSAVDDAMTVAEDSGTSSYMADAWISNQLRYELFTDLEISKVNYNVETVDKVIHLTGLARSHEELAQVIEHARSIEGVTRVVSHVLTIDDPRRVGIVATNT